MTPSSFSDPSIAFVRADPAFPEGPRPRAFQRAIGRQAVRAHNGVRRPFFSPRGLHPRAELRGPPLPRLSSPNKKNTPPPPPPRVPPSPPPPPAALGLWSPPPRGAALARPPSGDRREGRDGRGRPEKGNYHGDRSRRRRLRTSAHVISHRSCAQRASALRLSALSGRARSPAVATSQRR